MKTAVNKWRHFVVQLYTILEAAHDVSPKDKLLIWQDSFGVRAAVARHTEAMSSPLLSREKAVWWLLFSPM